MTRDPVERKADDEKAEENFAKGKGEKFPLA